MELIVFVVPWLAFGAALAFWRLDKKDHARQMQSLLDRISTEPRIELRPTPVKAQPDPGSRRYIADHEADDFAWNEYRGEPLDDVA